VGEGAAPSRHANLAFSRAYKTPLHGWCYPPSCAVVSKDQTACRYCTSNVLQFQMSVIEMLQATTATKTPGLGSRRNERTIGSALQITMGGDGWNAS
jgi:hypothetical protein